MLLGLVILVLYFGVHQIMKTTIIDLRILQFIELILVTLVASFVIWFFPIVILGKDNVLLLAKFVQKFKSIRR